MPAHSPPHRYAAVDMLRGLAMVWMTLFHLSFDLQHFGFLQANFYDESFWTLQRTAIVSLFVLCAGLGQAIAVQQGQSWERFWKRWRQIALCALAVSAGSYWMFPNGYIYFGILHGMSAMLIVVRLLSGTPWGAGARLCGLGALALALPALARQAHTLWPALDFLNVRTWNWLGLISRKPITEDYAPLLPWLGVMCLGLATGQWLLRRHGAWLERLGAASAPGLSGAALRGLAFLGRWSLSYYMLHQPLLMGVVGVLAWLRQV